MKLAIIGLGYVGLLGNGRLTLGACGTVLHGKLQYQGIELFSLKR